MPQARTSLEMQFAAKLSMPAKKADVEGSAFLILPKEISRQLPRRGRTSVSGEISGQPFQATLEPDGHLSHWMMVTKELYEAAGRSPGDIVTVQIVAVAPEPEPQIPGDFLAALTAAPQASQTWEKTTVIARVDWIHWITSAKQLKTRAKRIQDACSMLADGKKRVCCFDPSGYYSKAFSAPVAAE